MLQMMEIFAIIMFFISLYGLISTRNIVKSIIYVLVMQTTVMMYWLTIGRGAVPPIIYDEVLLENMQDIADPLPQALMITAIIIGVSVAAVMITMLNTVYRKHKMTEWEEITQAENEAFRDEFHGASTKAIPEVNK